MKRIFSVVMALMLILSTTSQAMVVTINGQNCTYTMTSPANREITVNDSTGNVRWWKVEDTSNNKIGAIDGTFVTPDSDVTVTPMLEGNQIIIQQTSNGDIKYNGNKVNTVETTENQSYTLTITPNEGYEIETVKVDNVALGSSEITASGMSYTFSSVNANHIITATYIEQQVAGIGTPNAPVIATGLTPVNWDSTANNGEGSWVTTTQENWDYNYEIASNEDGSEKEGVSSGEIAKWANAQTADGSLYVWIPRYTYKITSGYHQDVDSWNADSGDNKTGKIEIKFSNGTTDDITEGATNASEGYISHPAFTFGTTDLEGIWVAKYEASRDDATASSSGSGTTVSSKPGVKSWTNISVSDMFDYSYNLNRDLDSHLMKNVEWGAVAYLTNAIGRIPYINNSSSLITGNAGGSQDASSASGVTNAWNTAGGVKASTTHNVYGIYDLSGGSWEYVAAYYTGGSSTYLADDTTNKTYAGSLYTAANNTATAKYVDTYDTAYTSAKLGDAVYETSSGSSGSTSWDGDYSNVPHSNGPVFPRGGYYNHTSSAGVFYFSRSIGDGYGGSGFRPCLAIQ